MIKQVFLLTSLALILSCKSTPDLPDAHQAGWKGQIVNEIIFEDANVRVLKCTFPPNVGHEKHYHVPHFGYTVAGSKFQITDENGTRVLDVKTGSMFSKSEISVHEILNVGDSTGVFLIYEYK